MARKPTATKAPAIEFRELRIADLVPSPHNPRKIVGGDTDPSLDTLASSIERQGVIEPILVRRKEGAWEILAGERRWRASRRVFGGSGTIPAMVRDVDDHAAPRDPRSPAGKIKWFANGPRDDRRGKAQRGRSA